MTNSEIVHALQRWSHHPGLGPYARLALTRAARRLLEEESSLAERSTAGTLTELVRVGPFVARTIRELLDGSRPALPPLEEWPADDRALLNYWSLTELERWLAAKRG